MSSLPKPEVVRCYHDSAFQPPMPAMILRWDADAPGLAERLWHLPNSLTVKGAAPTRFGITIQRQGPNAFRIRCLWNELGLQWTNLSRNQIMASSLAQVLAALGTELWYLLEQPLEELQTAAA
jgi:hypothetical protein